MEHRQLPHAAVALLLLLLTSAPEAPSPPCASLSRYVVSVAPDAKERWAAIELVDLLQRVACPTPAAASCRGPPLVDASGVHPDQPQIAVGCGAAVLAGLPVAGLTALTSNESFLVRSLPKTNGSTLPSVVVTGGRSASRGTIYATTRLLEELGVVFLATDETVLPPCPHPSWSAALNVSRGTPAFEYRDCDASPNRNLTYNLRQHYNGQSALAGALEANDTAHGGYVQYAGGFVHTSYSILGGSVKAPGGNGPPLDLFRCAFKSILGPFCVYFVSIFPGLFHVKLTFSEQAAQRVVLAA